MRKQQSSLYLILGVFTLATSISGFISYLYIQSDLKCFIFSSLFTLLSIILNIVFLIYKPKDNNERSNYLCPLITVLNVIVVAVSSFFIIINFSSH